MIEHEVVDHFASFHVLEHVGGGRLRSEQVFLEDAFAGDNAQGLGGFTGLLGGSRWQVRVGLGHLRILRLLGGIDGFGGVGAFTGFHRFLRFHGLSHFGGFAGFLGRLDGLGGFHSFHSLRGLDWFSGLRRFGGLHAFTGAGIALDGHAAFTGAVGFGEFSDGHFHHGISWLSTGLGGWQGQHAGRGGAAGSGCRAVGLRLHARLRLGDGDHAVVQRRGSDKLRGHKHGGILRGKDLDPFALLFAGHAHGSVLQ